MGKCDVDHSRAGQGVLYYKYEAGTKRPEETHRRRALFEKCDQGLKNTVQNVIKQCIIARLIKQCS